MAAPPTTGVACPAYAWPQDATQRGPKVFRQSDCAACHSMLPYPVLRDAAAPEMVAQAAEIVVVAAMEETQLAAAAAMPLYGGAPDLATVATKIQDGLRTNLYSTGGATAAAVCQELKVKIASRPSSVWVRFAQPYLRAFQAGSMIDPSSVQWRALAEA